MTGVIHASRRTIPVALAAMLFLVAAGRQTTAAQEASPEASPVAGGIPCTTLFGIEAGNACVIAVHAVPDSAALDFYVDGELLVAGAQLGGLGDYLPVLAGVRQLQITPTGADLSEAIVDAEVEFAEGVAYEVAVVGSLAEVELRIYPVDTNPLDDETARFRFVNAAPDAPAVDLVLAGEDVPLITNTGFPNASPYGVIVPDLYDLETRESGTTNVVLPLPGTLFEGNFVYSLYLMGTVADATLFVFIVPLLISPDVVAAPEATPSP